MIYVPNSTAHSSQQTKGYQTETCLTNPSPKQEERPFKRVSAVPRKQILLVELITATETTSFVVLAIFNMSTEERRALTALSKDNIIPSVTEGGAQLC